MFYLKKKLFFLSSCNETGKFYSDPQDDFEEDTQAVVGDSVVDHKRVPDFSEGSQGD